VTDEQLAKATRLAAEAGVENAEFRAGYIEGAGLQIVEWRENPEYRFVSERADNAVRKYGVTSVSLLARHPG
jgi:arsenite methyltransferase